MGNDAKAKAVHQLINKLNRRLKRNQRVPFIIACVDPVETVDPKTKQRVVEQHIKVASFRVIKEPGGEHLVNALLDYLQRNGLLPGQPEGEKDVPPSSNNLNG